MIRFRAFSGLGSGAFSVVGAFALQGCASPLSSSPVGRRITPVV
jgi:hypothetical protein